MEMEKILVTGATGKLGTEVVNLLLKKTDPKNISVLVRDTTKAVDFKKAGITIQQGDYGKYNSLLNAFKGIDKLYFISTNAMTDREIQHENVVKAAVEDKVKNIIYTSFQRKNDLENSPISFLTKAHVYTEKLIKESGIAYTILKHGLYTDFLPVLLGNLFFETGSIYLPAGNNKVAFTLRSDLAEGAVEILTSKGHENKTYNFVADKLYNFYDIAIILSQLTGKNITYISPSNEEYKSTLLKAGVPEAYVNMFAGCSEGIRQNEFDFCDKTLSKLLKRECTDIEKYLREVYIK